MEMYPTQSTNQSEDDRDLVPAIQRVERDKLKNYSEREEYLYRRAARVALEVFGDDFSRPGMFFTEAGSDHDVPYMVVCEGDGHITSYNLFFGSKAAARGLNGFVITEAEAEHLRAAALGPR